MRWKVTIFGSLFLLALVTGVILSVWFIPEKNSAGFYFGVAACLLLVIALFITLLVEVPIDNQIRTWDTRNSSCQLDGAARSLGGLSHSQNIYFIGWPV
jgi:peptidoglycan/LPS O-acetylase OafA/YrhL